MRPDRLRSALLLTLWLSAMTGLFIAAAINFTFFGRPDVALLNWGNHLVEQSLDCKNPEQSDFFAKEDSTSLLNKFSSVSWFLIDNSSQRVILTKASKAYPPPTPTEIFHDLGQASTMLDMWHKARISLNEIPQVCGKNWSLIAVAMRPQDLLKWIFPRQLILFLITASVMILTVFLIYFYLKQKGREAEVVLKSLAEGQLDERLPLHRFERFFNLAVKFNHMAEATSGLIKALRESKLKQSQLIAELAHDLRTPLASLSGIAETLKDFNKDLPPPNIERLYQNLWEDANYVRKVLDDLLFLAEIDQFEPEKEFSPVDLRSILDRCYQRLLWEAEKRDLAVSWETDGKLPLILGSDLLLQRLFMNICENCCRYASSQVQLKWEISQEHFIHIYLCNDALSEAAESLAQWGQKRKRRVFHKDPLQPGASLGLGSSIALQLSMLHGGSAHASYSLEDATKGKIWVSIRISLPFIVDNQDDDGLPTQ